jgi:methyl-accepting chemotaxis protein
MEKLSLLKKNEQEACGFASKVMLITIGFLVLVYLLNVVGIFIVPQKPMLLAMSIGIAALLVPSLLVFVLKCQGPWVKYVIVAFSIIMTATLNVLLSWHAVLIFIYPIAISTLFFSRSLSWYALVLSLILFTASQIFSMSSGGVVDNNLLNLSDMIMFGILPRMMELLAISIIFIVLSKRTKTLLKNAVGAEEQKTALDRVITLTDKSYEVSTRLAESVQTLLSLSTHADKSNERIALETGNIVSASNQTLSYVDDAGVVVAQATSDINTIAKENSEMAHILQDVMSLTKDNADDMKDAAGEMQRIDAVTKESKAIILSLAQKSSEIAGIANVISSIAKKTNLLSLNASIESAQAGEYGKGFAVVASEIRNLAGQARTAASNIAGLIEVVLADTQKAVQSMNRSAEMVENGLELISRADRSTRDVTGSIEKVTALAQNTDNLSASVAVSGQKINESVAEIDRITSSNLNDLKTILKALEEQRKAMNEVTASVQSINSTSNELLHVVNQKVTV